MHRSQPEFFYQRLAALAIVTLNGSHQFGKPMRVNRAYASQREDTSGLSKLIGHMPVTKKKIIRFVNVIILIMKL
ncbi:hypothetical protein HanPSC8_Chr08g0323211 [Helianthus annuus]|nr:hypothetical protein HanPSC8_Chr08g0323211 [Helianthus annuus]